MQILDILEPQVAHEKTRGVAIGIDLGTTNSLGAVFKDGKIEYLGEMVPSRISCKDDQLAIDYCQDSTGAYSFKSLMGKKILDLNPEDIQSKNICFNNNQVQIAISGKNYTPEELSSFVLKKSKGKLNLY